MALKNEKVVINWVHERVKKGGHGVPDEVVKKRYNQSNHILAAVAFKADNVVICDNSQKFVSVYRREHDQVIKNNPDLKIRNPMNDSENKNDRPSY